MANQKSNVLSYLNQLITDGYDITQLSKEEILTGVRQNIDVNVSERAVNKTEREIRRGTLTSDMIQQQVAAQQSPESSDENLEYADNSSNQPAEIDETRIGDMQFNETYLFKTGTTFDRIMSDDLGIYSGCVYVFPGESGAGKSTLLLDMLSQMIENPENENLRPVYVSSEMTTNDLQFYYRRNPNIYNIPTILLEKYLRDGNIFSCISQIFDGRYNIIILDSFEDTIGKMSLLGMKRSTAEFRLLTYMLDAAENNNVTTMPIQHMTKGGNFKGDSTLIYLTQGMINVRLDKSGERYVISDKNRRGGITHRPLYFNKRDNGRIEFEEERFNRMLEGDTFEEEEKGNKENSEQSFDSIFNLNSTESSIEDVENLNDQDENEDEASITQESLTEDV